MFKYEVVCTDHRVLGLCKEVLTSWVSNLSGGLCVEPAGWGPPCHFAYTPHLRASSLFFVPGVRRQAPLPLTCKAPVQAAEPANNPLEISNHFVCLKLNLHLSASRTRAGELGTVVDLCVPLSVLCVGDGGGRGPGDASGQGHSGCHW